MISSLFSRMNCSNDWTRALRLLSGLTRKASFENLVLGDAVDGLFERFLQLDEPVPQCGIRYEGLRGFGKELGCGLFDRFRWRVIQAGCLLRGVELLIGVERLDDGPGDGRKRLGRRPAAPYGDLPC